MKKLKKMHTVLIFVVLAVIGVLFSYKASPPSFQKSQEKPYQLTIVATFFPFADIARSVGGADIEVIQLVQDGQEPHEYEPSVQDVERMLTADIFFMNGGSIDGWAEKLIPEAEQRGVRVVRMSDISPEVVVADTHAWMDFAYAQKMTNAIRQALAEQDGYHAEDYQRRADTLYEEIEVLDRTFFEVLHACTQHDVFVIHNAFSAWEVKYELMIHALVGQSSEAEPSLHDIAQFVEEARKKEASTIFFEALDAEPLAHTVAQEIGATTKMLSPLEGRTAEDITQSATYVTLMEKNLATLTHALSCQK